MIKTADVIVIGSGIVGSATAYELAKARQERARAGKSTRTSATARPAEMVRACVWPDVSPEAELAAMAIYDIWPTLGRGWTRIWSMSSAAA